MKEMNCLSKSLFVLLLFQVVWINTTYAQNLDSLWSIWQNTKLADTTRAQALNKYVSEGFVTEKPDSGIYLATIELNFATQKELPRVRGLALNNLGRCYKMKKEYEKAENYFNESFAVQKEAGYFIGMGYPLYNLAKIYEEKGDLKRAEEYWLRRLAVFETFGNDEYVGGALVNIAHFWYVNEERERALPYRKQANQKYLLAGDSMSAAWNLGWIGYIYGEKGQLDSSLFYREKSTEMAKAIGSTEQVLENYQAQVDLCIGENELVKAFEFAQQCYDYCWELNDSSAIGSSAIKLGESYYLKGLYSKALNYSFVAESYLPESAYSERSNLYNQIGTIYEEGTKNYELALEYYDKVSSIIEVTKDTLYLIQVYLNKGTINGYLNNYDEAFESLSRLETLAETYDAYSFILPYCYARIANVYESMGKHQEALTYNQRVIPFLGNMNVSRLFGYKPEFLAQIGLSYYQNGDFQNGLKYCEEGYDIALSTEDYARQRVNCNCLYNIYNELGLDTQALKYIQRLTVIKDTLASRESSKNIQTIEFERQLRNDSIATAEKERLIFEAYQDEIRAEEKTRNISLGVGALVLIVAGGLFTRLRYVRKSKATLQKEKDRSENLLLNILPADIAEELKTKGKADARDFDMVSILFTDFKGFTAASAKLSAQDLVSEINTCFAAFDGIIGKYGIEKIKTIGDAYMAAGGLPVPNDHSIKNTVLAALEMQAFITKRKSELDALGLPAFEMRVGVHTGPVVAGIVGVKKFQYDIWGDTVNTASRMESSGEIGKVNISQSTYDLVKYNQEFAFESRGKIVAKGKGEMAMWFVDRSS